MKDIAIIQLQKLPDALGQDGVIHKNRFKCLPQMGLAPKAVTGIHKLAQFITKILLTTQGSDLFDPDYGSGLLYLLKDSRTLEEINDLKAQVATHITDVRRQVIVSQTNLNLPGSERLQDLSLVSVDFDDTTLSLLISVKLVSEAGENRIVDFTQVLAEDQA